MAMSSKHSTPAALPNSLQRTTSLLPLPEISLHGPPVTDCNAGRSSSSSFTSL